MRRMRSPSLLGLMPMSDSWMARSMSRRLDLSKGVIISVWESGTLTLPICLTGVGAPK